MDIDLTLEGDRTNFGVAVLAAGPRTSARFIFVAVSISLFKYTEGPIAARGASHACADHLRKTQARGRGNAYETAYKESDAEGGRNPWPSRRVGSPADVGNP